MPSFIRVLKDRLGHCARPEGRDEPFRARVFAEPALQRTDSISTPRFHLSSKSDDQRRRVRRVLKDRLGHCARPEGRGEPFRARVFAEPAPFAALRAGFQRTVNSRSTQP